MLGVFCSVVVVCWWSSLLFLALYIDKTFGFPGAILERFISCCSMWAKASHNLWFRNVFALHAACFHKYSYTKLASLLQQCWAKHAPTLITKMKIALRKDSKAKKTAEKRQQCMIHIQNSKSNKNKMIESTHMEREFKKDSSGHMWLI